MEPIISPWIVYAISLATDLKVAFRLITFVAGLVMVFSIADEEFKRVKIAGVLCIITALISLLIPTKETLITMLVASYTTPDNLSLANEVFKSNLQDYINIITKGISNIK